MSTFETIIVTAVAVTLALAPKAIDSWLARRDETRLSHEESLLERAVGGAE